MKDTARTVRLEPLDALQFAPFGDVLHNDGAVKQRHYPHATLPGEAPGAPRLSVSHVQPVGPLPLAITQLERHPYAAQTFIPLGASPWVIVVAPALPGGQPDAAGLRAFLAAPGMGITYHRGTWHYGATVLDAPSPFAVLMWRREAGDDDQFQPLDMPVLIQGG